MQRWSKRDLVRSELIGKYIHIEASHDPTQVGLRGWIVDESRNTLHIEAAPTWDMMYPEPGLESDIKRIAKRGTVANIYRKKVDDRDVTGNLEPIKLDLTGLAFRPEDRNKRLRKVR